MTEPTAYRSLQEVAADLQWDRGTVRRAAQAHGVPLFKLPGNRNLLIRATDVEKLRHPIRVSGFDEAGYE